jgi:2-haloalkanoic acid dehalogenase type II
MSQLSAYRLLSFDVYGTLVDWEEGICAALQVTLDRYSVQFKRDHLLKLFEDLEHEHEAKAPGMLYSELLAAVHPALIEKLGLPSPTAEENKRFGEAVAHWPVFPDTLDALKRLSKHYKLVVVSNVDRESFAKTNAGSLQGFPFDLVLTAQDIGSYKPDLRNFQYLLKAVKEKLEVESDQVLHTAQSQFHDHQPAQKMGIRSVWIARSGAVIGNVDEAVYDWRFDTLGEMADAVDAENADSSVG